MILYHFTSRQLLEKVESEGITRCVIPWTIVRQTGKVRMMGGVQWLTVDPEFDSQSWAEPGIYAEHLMRKTDWRITVEIPNLALFKLYDWREFAARHRLQVADYFRTFPGNQHWRVFQGSIPRAWFRERMRNPTHHVLGDILEYAS